jgi:hypothetical protein
MSRYDEFIKNLKDGRCKNCNYARCVTATGGFMFLGCYCRPYNGKRVTEIKDCPKEVVNEL